MWRIHSRIRCHLKPALSGIPIRGARSTPASPLVAFYVEDVPNPRANANATVSDCANVFTTRNVSDIEEITTRIQKIHNVECGVVTIAKLASAKSGSDVAEFAKCLYDHWAIGDKETNAGLLWLVSTEQRYVELVTGAGVRGALTDVWVTEMLDEIVAPVMKRDQIAEGIIQGLLECEKRMQRHSDALHVDTFARSRDSQREARERERRDSRWKTGGGRREGSSWASRHGNVAAIIVFMLVTVLVAREFANPRCEHCREKMEAVPEESPQARRIVDDHATACTTLEQALGAAKHNAYECPKCKNTAMVASPNASWSQCNTCGCVTTQRQAPSILDPTLVVYKCANCKHTATQRQKSKSWSPSDGKGSSDHGSWGGGSSVGAGGGGRGF